MGFDFFGSDPKNFGFASVHVPWWYRRRMKALCYALVTIWPELKLARTKGWLWDHYMSYGPDFANGVLMNYLRLRGDDESLPATVVAVYRSMLQELAEKQTRKKAKRMAGRLEQ